MPRSIELPESLEHRLAKRAAEVGKTFEVFTREVLEQAAPAREKTLDELLAPFRQSFAESGLTEEELDALVDEARTEVWNERHGAKP